MIGPGRHPSYPRTAMSLEGVVTTNDKGVSNLKHHSICPKKEWLNGWKDGFCYCCENLRQACVRGRFRATQPKPNCACMKASTIISVFCSAIYLILIPFINSMFQSVSHFYLEEHCQYGRKSAMNAYHQQSIFNLKSCWSRLCT